eukprot:g4773.t1
MASIADYGDYDINTIETIITFLSKTENNGILNNENVGEKIREYLQQESSKGNNAQGSNDAAKINIGIHGATGRLGSLITKQCDDASTPNVTGYKIGRDLQINENCNVIIDVTLPEGTKALIEKLMASGSKIPLIIGTTGDLPMDTIKKYANEVPVAIVPNFSVGIPLVTKLAQAAVKQIPSSWNVEMTETHHTRKLDAPSGTAKKLLNAMSATNAPAVEGKEIPCYALRLGDVFGEHSIHLAGPGERVEITHRATRREVFAIGAVRSAKWITTQPAGLYDGLKKVL